MVCGILEAKNSGKGQAIDVSMVEGSSLMMSLMHSLMANHRWAPMRGVNLLDGGAHFYDTFETSDGKYVSFGAMEAQFMQTFTDKTGLDESWMQNHLNFGKWPELKEELRTLFKTKTQKEWCDLLEGSDACFAPIIPFWEAHKHPHNIARESFVEIEGLMQPAPAPKFSRTSPKVSHGPVPKGAHTDEILKELGLT